MTISKKNGRKLSKLGYPYPLELDMDHVILLSIDVGIKKKVAHILFPIHVKLTKDKPVCGLTMHMQFDNFNFDFQSCYKNDDIGHNFTRWTNHKEGDDADNPIYLTPSFSDEESCTVGYQNIITPYAQSLEDLIIF